MKTCLIILSLLFTFKGQSQILKLQTVDYSSLEIRCGVAHCTTDGCFSCDFKGTYYPYHIYDTMIRKWFIKMVAGDSLFYYRSDVIRIYIWNGRPKNEEYGYESEGMKKTGVGVIIPDKYTTDTLRFTEQVWRPRKK